MNETMAEIIPNIINSLLRGVHTAIPGKIEKYDRNTFRAEITPSIKHLTLKNEEVEVKPLTDVPIIMIGGSSGIIDIELVKGDNVLILICESGIGGWKSSDGGKQVAPDDLAHHTLNDAVAIPCLIPDGQSSSFANVPRILIDKNGDMALQNDNGNIKLSAAGQASMNDHFTVDP
jgi:hypothetical protein